MRSRKVFYSAVMVLVLVFSPALLMADILDDATKRGVVRVGVLPDAKPYGWHPASFRHKQCRILFLSTCRLEALASLLLEIGWIRLVSEVWGQGKGVIEII